MSSLEPNSNSARSNAELAGIFPGLRFGRYLTLGTQRLHYIDAGQGDPVLCVHGNPTWSFYWRALIEELHSTHRVVAVDHIGCGLSDKPQRYNYCLEQHIDNLCQVIERLNLAKITLVVHDWGGPIGVGAAERMPERIQRLVLTNTACFPPPYVPRRIMVCRLPLFGSLVIRGANAFARSAVRMATEQPGGLDSSTRRGYLAPYDSWANRVAVQRFVADIPLSPRYPTWQLLEKIEAGLARFARTPCLLIWGMRDWCFRQECLRRLQRLLPQAQSVEIPDAGHYLMEDAPRQVIAAIKTFLQTTPPTLPKARA